MRFDDSLKTVLAADASTAFGAQATFRQLADLIARGRVPADAETLSRLRVLRDQVPVGVRAAVARSFALAQPPVALVALFAEDEPGVAAAALRVARLPAQEWMALIPQLGPSGRAALRRRDDLDLEVERALASFGPTDFALVYTPRETGLGSDALDERGTATPIADLAQPDAPTMPLSAGDAGRPSLVPGGFDIGELVDRIASYQEQRAASPPTPTPVVDHFRFQTNGEGVIRWTDAAPRGALIGAALIGWDKPDNIVTSNLAAQAFRERVSFNDASVVLGGAGPLQGEWRISAIPLFEPATGQFLGFQGAARRPWNEQVTAAVAERSNAEGLRRLVHELRTPTNAIAGFSELIETELLGPVAPPYRERAAAIRLLAADLVTTIEDLDLAARIEGNALELRAAAVALGALLARVAADLSSLASARGCTVELAPVNDALRIAGDERAMERLFGRLIATLAAAAQEGEAILVQAAPALSGGVDVAIGKPRAFANLPEERLLDMEAGSDAAPGSPLLGTGFALRLARDLAVRLGGALLIRADRITVTLPTAAAAGASAAAAGQAVST